MVQGRTVRARGAQNARGTFSDQRQKVKLKSKSTIQSTHVRKPNMSRSPDSSNDGTHYRYIANADGSRVERPRQLAPPAQAQAPSTSTLQQTPRQLAPPAQAQAPSTSTTPRHTLSTTRYNLDKTFIRWRIINHSFCTESELMVWLAARSITAHGAKIATRQCVETEKPSAFVVSPSSRDAYAQWFDCRQCMCETRSTSRG